MSACKEVEVEKPCVAHTRCKEMAWVEKGCSAQCRVVDSYRHLSSSLISTASSSQVSADFTAEEPFEFPNVNWSRPETLGQG